MTESAQKSAKRARLYASIGNRGPIGGGMIELPNTIDDLEDAIEALSRLGF